MALHILNCVIIFCFLFLVWEPLCGECQLVTTKTGKFRGKFATSRDGREFYEWIGIPFAEPPVGSLRFRPPVPVKPHSGIRDTTRFNVIRCPQILIGTTSLIGSEDCLYLNIHSPVYPSEDNKKLLPVIFVIHGGYFMLGSGRDINPNYFMDEDVMVVTCNYRLGVLGFLNTGDGVVQGNMGLKDQSMALKWVYENIANFGGDPKRITIYGESAGAVSVHMHLLSPLSKGYVYKAISHSGTALSPWAYSIDAGKQAKWLARGVGCPTNSSWDMITCFNDKGIGELFKYLDNFTGFGKGVSPDFEKSIFVPSFESGKDETKFLTEKPTEILRERKFAKVPWMVLVNSGEGLIISALYKNNRTRREHIRSNWPKISQYGLFLSQEEKQVSKYIQQHYFPRDISVHSSAGLAKIRDMYGDKWFNVPVHDALRIHGQVAPVFNFYYNKSSDFSLYDVFSSVSGRLPVPLEIFSGMARLWLQRNILRIPEPFLGVSHAEDMLMLSPTPGYRIGRNSRQYVFSKQLVNLWAQFASDAKNLYFQGNRIPLFDPEDEFKYFALNEAPQSRTTHVPFEDGYFFWKSFERIAKKV